MWDNKRLADRQVEKEREQMATFEQLRTVLNQIAEGPDKAVLEKAADHLSSDGSRYEIDLVISATNGTMVFIDHCPEVSED